MGIILWIIFGGLAGWIMGRLMPTEIGNLKSNITIGIYGALIAGWIVTVFLGWPTLIGINLTTVGVSTIGAISFIGMVRLFHQIRIKQIR
jgi:uncharacterized membrane protein YeaQ/YmgE (transglycosylase-associated protein family)